MSEKENTANTKGHRAVTFLFMVRRKLGKVSKRAGE
jgi:hypothetical protein